MYKNFAKNTLSKILTALMIVALAVGMLPVKQAYAVGPIAALDAWQTTPQMTGTTGNPANATFSISTGTERLLIVLVSCYDSAGGAGQTFTATYGGKPLTQAFLQNTNRRQTWIGYLNEADITGRVGNTVAVTVTGAHTNVAAYIASYSGVHQTNPITASGGAYVNNTNGVTIGGPLTVNAGGYGVYGWAGSAGLTRVSDTETYTEHSDVNNAGTFDYGVASQAFAASSSTNPTVTWSANIRASVSFITLNPATSGPLLSAPTATSIADITATLGATITSNNGSAVGWDYLINKSTTGLNNTTAQNWNIQIGSINTGTELFELREKIEKQEKLKARKDAERKRIQKLEKLSQRQEEAWAQVAALCQEKRAKTYDESVQLLGDLRELGEHTNQENYFQQRFAAILEQYSKSAAFKDRLRRAGLI